MKTAKLARIWLAALIFAVPGGMVSSYAHSHEGGDVFHSHGQLAAHAGSASPLVRSVGVYHRHQFFFGFEFVLNVPRPGADGEQYPESADPSSCPHDLFSAGEWEPDDIEADIRGATMAGRPGRYFFDSIISDAPSVSVGRGEAVRPSRPNRTGILRV